ncbi:MAG: hypothetical protein AABX29_02030 [Nanoarchaeota archaeon]
MDKKGDFTMTQVAVLILVVLAILIGLYILYRSGKVAELIFGRLG